MKHCAACAPYHTAAQVFFDVSIGGNAAGRVTIGLFGGDVPKVNLDCRVSLARRMMRRDLTRVIFADG